MGSKDLIKKLKRKKILIIVLISLIVLIFSTLAYFIFRKDFVVKSYKESVIVNYKDKYKEKTPNICYGNNLKCIKLKIKSKGKVDTSKLGKYKLTYSYSYKNKKRKLTQNVIVKDIGKPEIKLESKNALVCPSGKIYELKYKITDNMDGDITKKAKQTFDKSKKTVTITIKDSKGNKTEKTVKAIVEDKVAPVISINGGESKSFTAGFHYEDEGASAKDNCDENVKVETSGDVNYDTPGTYEITYKATDSSKNTSEVKRTITIKSVDSGYRIVYLTFDDGPSEYTNELLDILSRYGVKVTFFVTGNGSDDVIKREADEGHTIALHTNSHDYSYVYSSIDNYFADLYAVRDRVKRITGIESNLIRFPGGSSNTVSMNYDGGIEIMSQLVDLVQNRGFSYFDWNVSSGDGGGTISTDAVYNNVINNIGDGSSVVLQHDTKKYSIDAVARIIEYCQSNGYTFRTLSESSPKAHHGVNN